MIQKVVFPSFRENEYSQYDMRQLVSALELRFQSLESNVEGFFPTSADADFDDRYAAAVHTHLVADIIDFDANVPSSIFDLDDVTGTASVGQGLIWNGAEFVAGPLGGSTNLNDLLDVNAASPSDGEALVWDVSTLRWVPGTASGGGGDSLFGLTDTDLAGQLQGDLLFNANGTEWQATGWKFQWVDDQYLQFGNDIGINWYDGSFNTVELLNFTPPVTIPADNVWANVVLLADFEGADGATTYSEVSNNAGVASFFGTAALSNEQSHFGLTSLKLDGNSDYVSFPWISNNLFCPQIQPGDHDYTIDIWFYSTADTIVTEQFLCGATNSLGGAGWNLSLNPDRTIKFRSNKNGSNNYTVNGTIVCAVNRWHHIAYTYERISAGAAQNALYVNGVNDLSFQANPNLGTYDNGTGFYIGLGGVGSGYFQGYIDGVRLTQYVTRYPAITPVNFTVTTESWPLSVDTIETSPTSGGFVIGDSGYNTSIDGLEVSIISASTNVSGDLNVKNVKYDSAGGLAILEHDSLDFNATFVSTADWNITGLNSAVLDKTTSVSWLNDAVAPVVMLAYEDILVNGDPSWSSVSLLADFDGADAATAYTSIDLTGHVFGFFGNAQLDTAEKYSGTASLLLDGSGDTVRIAAYNANLAMVPSTDFTVECWIRPSATIQTNNTIIIKGNGSLSYQSNYRLKIRTDNTIEGVVRQSTGAGPTLVSTGTAPINTWTHIALTYVAADTEFFLFVGGNLEANVVQSLPSFADNLVTSWIQIGWEQGRGGTDYFPGHIDGLRITKGVARYTASFTPSADAWPDLGTPFEAFTVGDPGYPTVVDGQREITLISGAPKIFMQDSDATADEGNWIIANTTDQFRIETASDAAPETPVEAAITIERTGTTVDYVEMPRVIAGDPGTESSGITVNGGTYQSVIKASDIGGTNAAQFIMHRHSTTLPAAIVGARSKDDTSAHTIVADNDVILGLYAAGWDGVDSYSLSSAIEFEIDGTPGQNDMPGQISFYTSADGTELLVERMRIRSTGDVEIDNDLTVAGDFTVSGTLTSINTSDLNVADNIIILNSGETGAPTLDAGIEIERGTSDNVLFRWNETSDVWEFTNDGTTYFPVVTEHTGEVTGSTALTLDVTAVTNRTDVVADAADDVAIHDDTDGTLKKVNLSSITDGGFF